MIIDLHFHTEAFSSCSRIPLEKGLERARDIGLGGICLTEHDVFHERADIDILAKRFGLTILIGTEIYTIDGDILCFGLDRIPDNRVTATELVNHLNRLGGATIAAHPFRKNDRGIKELISSLPGLTAVEAYNGNTCDENNRIALKLAVDCSLPVTAASDAHSIDRIGIFATEFPEKVGTVKELSSALLRGDYSPLRYTGEPGNFERLPDSDIL